jgi:hypothetical protein
MVSCEEVNWNNIEDLVVILSKKILDLPQNFSSISTVSRGGLIPSRLLADALGIKNIFVDEKNISSNSLFVDDIFDSGKTFENIVTKVDDPSKFIFATLFARRDILYPTQLIYATKTIDESYVVFPWDKLEFKNNLN